MLVRLHHGSQPAHFNRQMCISEGAGTRVPLNGTVCFKGGLLIEEAKRQGCRTILVTTQKDDAETRT